MSILKNKFIIKNDITEGQFVANDKSLVIDKESRLLKKSIQKKSKSELSSLFLNNKNEAAGNGFGNLNISNDIRFGNASRNNNKDYKEKRESQLSFDYQFNYLNKDFQNPNNIVMDIPRGGDITRKYNMIQVNTMRDFNNNAPPNINMIKSEITLDNIEFNY
jgi:hypothetical protein